MRKIFVIVLCCFYATSYTQVGYSTVNLQDSLKKLSNTNDPNSQVDILMNISTNYAYFKGDSGMLFLNKAKDVSIENNLIDRLPLIYFYMSSCNSNTLGNYPAALYYSLETLKAANQMDNKSPMKLTLISYAYYSIANSYSYLLNKKKSEEYLNKSFELFQKIKSTYNQSNLLTTYGVYAETCIRNKDFIKANKYNEMAMAINDSYVFKDRWGIPYISKGMILQNENKHVEAIEYFKKSIPHSIYRNVLKDQSEAQIAIAESYFSIQNFDSAILYCNKVIESGKIVAFNEGLQKSYHIMYQIYKLNKIQDSAYKYLEKYNDIRDVIFNNLKLNDAQNMVMAEELKQRDLAEQKAKQQKILILTGICAILLAIGIYLNGKRKQKDRLRKIEEDRKNSELKAARDLQQSMLPKENPKRSDLDIATFIRSSTEVGGDYYDFFPQADGSIFSVCGDATGHGVTSGMMVSVTKAGLNGINPVKPHKILQRLNGVVKRIDLGTLRMSLNIAEITKDEIYLSSAAMPPMYLYKALTKSIEEFMNNGLPLGGFKDEEFVLESRGFESGDVLVQLSDGLPEAPNSKGEMYDYERLKNLILSSVHLPSKEIIDVLIKSVDEWMEGSHNPDDITLVVTKKYN
jgi:serine phosphatase RsbU (regulator of sigma subunit)